MNDILLIGADDVRRAGHQIANAAQQFSDVVARMEAAFAQRRQWEEEYLQRIEAIVQRELDFYKDRP